jgi:hypothetical protein
MYIFIYIYIGDHPRSGESRHSIETRRPRKGDEEKGMYMYIYTYIYIYMYMCVHIDKKKGLYI